MRTALIVVVPEAEPLVGRLRERYDHPAGGLGVPAHITLLFPFGDDPEGLEELFAAAAPFDFELARTERFAEQPILYLAPEPAEPFVQLIEALIARYPGFPPFRGEYAAIVPHLTIGYDVPGEIEDSLRPSLPIRTRAETVTWLEEQAGGHWRERRRFALGG
ncbi:MAG TPA: 2'-5' RNA ligase family protein [Gaiellaceae bacterium]|nr:2'-5' RNA ligase family protein [Gaiellaceae bacterium]